MSSAYQYGVETTAQPAAIANVSAPEAICSRFSIRRDEHVRRGEQVRELVDREEAVVELDVVAEPEIERRAVRASGGTARPPDARRGCVRPAIRYSTSGCRSMIAGKRLDRRLQALAGRDQPERREQEARLHPLVATGAGVSDGRVRASSRAPRPSCAGAPCGTTRIFSVGQAPHLDEQPLRRVGHHDHALGLLAELCQHLRAGAASAPTAPCAGSRRAAAPAPARTRARTRRRGRRRSRTRAGAARRRCRAGRAAGRRGVVAAHALPDRREELRPLWARRLVDHDDEADVARCRATPSSGCTARRTRTCRCRMRAADTSEKIAVRTTPAAPLSLGIRCAANVARRTSNAPSVQRASVEDSPQALLMMCSQFVTPRKSKRRSPCGSLNTWSLHGSQSPQATRLAARASDAQAAVG